MQFLDVTSSSAIAERRLAEAPLDGAWDLPDLAEPRLHRIHAYPAKFPAFLTTRMLAYSRSWGVPVRRIGDVFCGCGTVAHEARRAGLQFWGCDINPVATLIARTKSSHCRGDRLRQRGTEAVERMKRVSNEASLSDAAARRLRRWFTPTAFDDLSRLRNAIEQVVPARSKYRPVLECAFSSILKSCSRWRQRSIKPTLDPDKKPADVRRQFMSQLALMADAFDEDGALTLAAPLPDIRLANVLTVEKPKELLDLIVTSPPYVTSYEYADLHQLSSLWLGYADDHRNLRNGSIGSSQHSLNLRKDHAELNRTGMQIVFSLYPEDSATAEAVAHYFVDMQRVAKRCREFLSPRGIAMFVIGNTRYYDVEVDNASHLAEALLDSGFSTVRAARRRISNKNATPFRDGVGRYSSAQTERSSYAEEYILIAHA